MAAAAKGMRPRAPTASTWSGMPAVRVMRAMSVNGCIVPISVHAAPIDTRVVSGRRARRTSSGLMRPSRSTDETGDLGAGRLERFASLGAEGVGSGRIANTGLEKRPHHGEHARIYRSEAGIVEIDPVGSGAPALHATTGSS